MTRDRAGIESLRSFPTCRLPSVRAANRAQLKLGAARCQRGGTRCCNLALRAHSPLRQNTKQAREEATKQSLTGSLNRDAPTARCSVVVDQRSTETCACWHEYQVHTEMAETATLVVPSGQQEVQVINTAPADNVQDKKKCCLLVLAGGAAAAIVIGIVVVVMLSGGEDPPPPCPPPALQCVDFTCPTGTYTPVGTGVGQTQSWCPEPPPFEAKCGGDSCTTAPPPPRCDPGTCTQAYCCALVVSGMCAGNTHTGVVFRDGIMVDNGVLIETGTGTDHTCASGYSLKAYAQTLLGSDDAICCDQDAG